MERSVHDRRALWAFWIACGLTAVAGVAPFLFGGGSNRIGLVYPFLLAAVALGACAVFYQQGKPVVAGLFFIAGVAIVLGSLAVIELPIRLAVIGTCSAEPAPCPLGQERPLTSGEATSLGFVIGIGVVGLFTGFFGLVNVYRRHAAAMLPPVPPTPPTRRIPPVATDAPPSPKAVAVPEPVAPEPAVELDELPAPAEPLELPAPEPVPAPRPRRRRTPKVPDASTPPNPDS